MRLIDSFSLKNLNPQSTTIVVTSLGYKQHLQQIWLSQYGALAEDSVLRASEFWQILARRNFPDRRLVNADYMDAVAQIWLADQKLLWSTTDQSSRLLLEYVEHFMPLLDADHSDATRQWLAQNKSAIIRWGEWFFLAEKFWREMESKKILLARWCAGLLSHSKAPLEWKKNLVFELGSDLTLSEAHLIKQVGFSSDTSVVSPLSEEGMRGRKFWSYQLLQDEAYSRMEGATPGFASVLNSTEKQPIRRFATALAEIEDVTGQVREWIDSGIKSSEIAIVSADIEKSWTALSVYFEKEGIPVAKPMLHRLTSRLTVSRWLAQLKLHQGQVDYADLQLDVYGDIELTKMPFADFKAKFCRLFDESDLQRDDKIAELYAIKIENNKLSFLQLLAQELESKRLRDEVFFELEDSLKTILQEIPDETRWSRSVWARFLERRLSRFETVDREANGDGIQLVNIRDLSPVQGQCKAIYFFNLCQEELLQTAETALSPSDVLSLAEDLGVAITLPDSATLEINLELFLQVYKGNYVISVANQSLGARSLAPAKLWLKQAVSAGVERDELNRQKPTMMQFYSQNAGWKAPNESVKHQREKSLSELLGQTPLDMVPWSADETFSASTIKEYFACPFKAAAKKIFKLLDLSEFDIDRDQREQGLLMHAVLEAALKELDRDRSEEEWFELIESCRKRLGYWVSHENVWLGERLRLSKMAQQFVGFERQWRRDYPATTTVACEYKFANNLFGHLFKGTIDRIDQVDGEYIIIDYKSTSSRLFAIKSWLDKGDFQLLIYSLCVQEGLTELPVKEVGGAFYFSLKNLSRRYGFGVDQLEGKAFALTSHNKVSPGAKMELLQSTKEKLAGLVQRMYAGDIAPSPNDFSNCADCRWRGLCRANHLN